MCNEFMRNNMAKSAKPLAIAAVIPISYELTAEKTDYRLLVQDTTNNIETERINYLSNHLKINKKDKHSRRGLLKLVGDRRRLIKYVERTTEDAPKVNKVMKELGLKATV